MSNPQCKTLGVCEDHYRNRITYDQVLPEKWIGAVGTTPNSLLEVNFENDADSMAKNEGMDMALVKHREEFACDKTYIRPF